MIGLSESLISSVKVYLVSFLESQSIACLNCTPDGTIPMVFQSHKFVNLVRQAVQSLRLVAFFIRLSQLRKQRLDQRAETAVVLL